MKVIDGKIYKCENGALVQVKKIYETLVYKFKAEKIGGDIDLNIQDAGYSEVWAEDGTACHYDCGWSFIEENKDSYPII